MTTGYSIAAIGLSSILWLAGLPAGYAAVASFVLVGLYYAYKEGQ